MKIAILLPYKENYSHYDTGAVSIFVNGVNKLSKFKNNIQIYGSTIHKPLSKNYKNLSLKKNLFQSSSKVYVKDFLKNIENDKIDILEIHNRPHYLKYLLKLKNTKKILFFHNNPMEMQGSNSIKEREYLIENSDMLIFNSNWTKEKFLNGFKIKNYVNKIKIIPQSTSKVSIDFSKKKKIISFVGKLNSAKGYDLFGNAVTKILDKYDNWKAIAIGNEPRQKLFYNHKNLINFGFKNNKYVLKKLEEVSIAIVPSRWDEPFGRSSLEAASRGCAIIRSNTGGLKETTEHSIVLKKMTSKELFKKIDILIKNKKKLNKLQKLNFKNFKLTNEYSSNLLDDVRKRILLKDKRILLKDKSIKILHITNFNERFNGRLHYNTGKRINNGLIRQGYNVYQLSDRDVISSNRSILNPSSKNILNKKILEIYDNFKPNLLILGHADHVEKNTLKLIKEKNENVKIAQWFLDPLSRHGPDYLNNRKRILDKIDLIDATFLTSDPNSLDFYIKNSHFIPNPADSSFEILNNSRMDLDNDVFFAMSHGVHRGNLKSGKHDDRETILKKLLKLKNIKFDFYGVNNIQPIWGDNFLNKISNSKIGLNLSRGKPVKYYSSDRIAQYMGNGLLTLIHENVQYQDFFKNDEIVTYKNFNDLVKKIKFFINNDNLRKKIANNGRRKYLREFSSEKISKYIVTKSMNINIKDKFLWE